MDPGISERSEHKNTVIDYAETREATLLLRNVIVVSFHTKMLLCVIRNSKSVKIMSFCSSAVSFSICVLYNVSYVSFDREKKLN